MGIWAKEETGESWRCGFPTHVGEVELSGYFLAPTEQLTQ